MQIKRIKCPKCGVVLDVKNSKEQPELLLNCPQCRAELLVKFGPREEPLEAPTFFAQPKQRAAQPNYGETQLGDAPQSSAAHGQKADLPQLRCNGEAYTLAEGRNIVGRKDSKKLATVPIDTDDKFMSRQHCVINVSFTDGKYKAILSNYENKNDTFINGIKIDKGDDIVLNDGNNIKMGNTILTFKS